MANKHLKMLSLTNRLRNVRENCIENFFPSQNVSHYKTSAGGTNVDLTSCGGIQATQTFTDISIKIQNSQARSTHDPAMQLLGVYLKDSGSAYYRDVCTSTSTAELFLTAKPRNQCRSPTMSEKLVYIRNGVLFNLQ